MISTRTLLLSIIVGIAASAAANPLPDCGWEYCDDTVLALDGPGIEPIIASRVTAPDPVNNGDYSLRLVHNAPGETPRAHLAYAEDLTAGTLVVFEIARYASDPGGGSCRFRGRYLPDNIDAGGPEDPGGSGWQWIAYQWTITGGHTGMIIEVEMTGEAGDTVWLDDMVAVPAGEGTYTLTIPCFYSVVPVATSTLSAVKDLFR